METPKSPLDTTPDTLGTQAETLLYASFNEFRKLLDTPGKTAFSAKVAIAKEMRDHLQSNDPDNKEEQRVSTRWGDYLDKHIAETSTRSIMAKQLQLCFDFLEEKEQQTEKVRKAVNILGKDRVRGDAQNPEFKITTPAGVAGARG